MKAGILRILGAHRPSQASSDYVKAIGQILPSPCFRPNTMDLVQTCHDLTLATPLQSVPNSCCQLEANWTASGEKTESFGKVLAYPIGGLFIHKLIQQPVIINCHFSPQWTQVKWNWGTIFSPPVSQKCLWTVLNCNTMCNSFTQAWWLQNVCAAGWPFSHILTICQVVRVPETRHVKLQKESVKRGKDVVYASPEEQKCYGGRLAVPVTCSELLDCRSNFQLALRVFFPSSHLIPSKNETRRTWGLNPKINCKQFLWPGCH